MSSRIRPRATGILSLLSISTALLFCGCALQVRATGGGQMPSTNTSGTDKAIFTISGNNCGTTIDEASPEFPATGNVSYKDMADSTFPGLRFHATLTALDQCAFTTIAGQSVPDACEACSLDYFPFPPKLLGGYGATLSYKSTNADYPDVGTDQVAHVCLIAPGQGPNNPIADDWVAIVVDSGPYSGYQNTGPILHGNIQAINCPAPQTVAP